MGKTQPDVLVRTDIVAMNPALTKIAKLLGKAPGFKDVYPELSAAADAYKKLTEGLLPDGYAPRRE